MARLLVLGGSRQAAAGLERLKALGLELVVCDMDPDAPGFAYAAHRVLASVYHAEECIPAVRAFHAHTPIDGVMCLACDVPHVVARIADELGLPGIPVESADLTVNKLAMKDRFQSLGVAIPPYRAIADVKELAGTLAEWGAVVVKPTDSRGSKGVSLMRAGGDVNWAFSNAQENSPSGKVMAEKYLSGPQVSTESIVVGGEAVTPAMSDRSYEFLDRFAPFIVENGGDMPSELDDAVKHDIAALVSKGATALGISQGIIKGDIVVHAGKPYIIELAARLSGGYFCTHQIPLSTGVDLVAGAARTALGETLQPADWNAKFERHVSTRWLIPESGRITGFSRPEAVLSSPGVLAFEHWAEIGARVGGAMNAAASVAMVQATGNTREEAVRNAETALDAFALTVEGD
ncbi:ATP-grasp domain-containing protein [Kordiimonas aestuarii]|uniref:ATP-grasp domain-containing protein n=1 Tax=Kordiimonas aestuarii TaxID=1005925 RepID=UPI0021D3AEB8|nr:ATP-grasp domain-containing protein [Kordiimonas aestuarii]